MKCCYVLPQGKAPRLLDHLMVRVSRDNLLDSIQQYTGFTGKLCFLVHSSVPLSSLLKFVETAGDAFAVVVHSTPDTTFLSRFPQVVVGLRHDYVQFPPKTRLQAQYEECRRLSQ
jgi:hypothetical protein